jgi:hypothetical protein
MSSLNIVRVSATIAGLTTATTLYTDGDSMGTSVLSWNMVSATGIITSAVMVNATVNIGAVDLFLFDRSVTAATNNAAHSISDADRLFALGIIQFPFPTNDALGQTAAIDSLGITWSANASQTIYGIPVTRSTHTVHFGAATDLTFILMGSKDV